MALHPNSRFMRSDGKSQSVRQTRVGDLVLGLDEDELLQPTEVLAIAPADSLTSDWYNLRTTRHETALGSSFYSLHVTSDHNIYSSLRNPRPVNVFTNDDCVQGIASTLNLDEVQKSILVGILLGDGSLHSRLSSGGSASALRWSHSTKQEDYMKWIIDALGTIAKLGHEDTSGYGSRILTARTGNHPDITHLFKGFNKASGDLPKRVEEMINPISMAFWYMDDGSLAHTEGQQDRASFATYSFSDKSLLHLINGLRRLGINSVIQNSSKGKTIRLNHQSARMMFTMIAPLVPPSMQYKLPSDLRGGPGWVPRPTLIPGYRNNPLRVVSNRLASVRRNDREISMKARPMEIITSLGNSYVNGMLVST